MNSWEKLFGKIGLWVIPLMAAAWIGQQLVGYNLADRMAARESRLRRDEVYLTRLAEQRASEIQRLHAEILGVEIQARNLYYLHMLVGIDPPQVRVEEVLANVRNLQELARQQRIYYPPALVNKVDAAVNEIGEVIRLLETREMLLRGGHTGSSDQVEELEKAAFEKLSNLSTLKEALEQEFRHIISTGDTR